MLVNTPHTELPTHLRLAVAAWLDECAESTLTHSTYHAEFQRFYAALQRVNLSVDSDPGLVSIVAQALAGAGEVQAATFNKKLAILSSFYTYAIQKRIIQPPNPIDSVRRRKVQRYRGAKSLDLDHVQRGLRAIDRSQFVGLRDYCLLGVGLQTGRRLSEIGGMRGSHLQLVRERLRVTWPACKGDKIMYDLLPVGLSRALLGYLYQLYGAQIGDLPADTPVWVSVSNNNRGGALSISALADICESRLGVSTFHTLRHTFARQLIREGATVSQLAARLGHASPATTAIYIEELCSDDHEYAEALALALGLGE